MTKSTIPITYGLLIAAGLIGYFLLLSLFGAHTNPIFSLVNGLIAALGIYTAIKIYKSKKGSNFKYQKGFGIGLFTGFNATVLFTIFIALYCSILNPEFLNNIEWRLTGDTGFGLFLFEILIMGLASTVVLTLSFMQLFKTSWNTKDGNRHTLNNDDKKEV